jgi:hypothetical protein
LAIRRRPWHHNSSIEEVSTETPVSSKKPFEIAFTSYMNLFLPSWFTSSGGQESDDITRRRAGDLAPASDPTTVSYSQQFAAERQQMDDEEVVHSYRLDYQEFVDVGHMIAKLKAKIDPLKDKTKKNSKERLTQEEANLLKLFEAKLTEHQSQLRNADERMVQKLRDHGYLGLRFEEIREKIETDFAVENATRALALVSFTWGPRRRHEFLA